MPLTCIYHKREGMKVVSLEDRDKLVGFGEWFDHPSCKDEVKVLEEQKEELKNEKQIRRRTRKRLSVSEQASI